MTKNRDLKTTIDYIYNPDNQSKQELIDSFVVRLKTFERLFADIKGAKMKSPEQHYLIEGKRGMGKTTLLLRLGYEIECDKKLNSWLIPIVFNEEEYSIRRLYKLWERIAQLMGEKSDEFDGLYDKMDVSYASYDSPEEYEYEIFKLLNQKLEEKGKKLILFIDNFGDIFQKFNKQEIQRLRTVLQTNTNLRLVVASSKVLEAFYDSKHPFYELFKITRLRGLDKEETNELLLKLGETYKQDQIKDILENQKGRVEALRRLTGGVIRTIVLLFEIFMDKKEGSAFSDLEAILDRVTPLYKHRMDDLPAQQQEIVEAIAFAWDAINVSEISQKTRIVSKTVSAQLRQMEKNEIIQKKLTSNKNHFYQVSERFFNIWYLMRHGRKGDKRKVLWLVRFLEEWCDEGELVERSNRHIKMLRKGTYNLNGAYYMTEALASTKNLPSEKQDELLKVTRSFLKENNSDFVQHLSESDLELFEKVKIFFKKNQYQFALDVLLKMRKIEGYHIGLCYHELKDYKNTEKYYLMAIDNNIVDAMFNLAYLYENEFNAFEKAEKYYLMAIDNNDIDSIFHLAHLYEKEFNAFKKAEKYYLMAVENNNTNAMVSLANLYAGKLNDFNKAEKYYLMAVENNNANAMVNLAILYGIKFKDLRKAEKYLLKGLANDHKMTMIVIGDLYFQKKKKNMEAFKFLKEYNKKGHHILFSVVFAKVLLWHDKFEESKIIANQLLFNEKCLTELFLFTKEYFFLLLAKKQYQFLYEYFTSSKAEELNIKNRLKPIWYALMYFMQDTYPNEYLRMGDELEETVKEIVKKVEQMKIDYA